MPKRASSYSQAGFTVVEGLLLLIILGGVLGVGVWTYQRTNNAHKTLDNAEAVNTNSLTNKDTKPTGSTKNIVNDLTQSSQTESSASASKTETANAAANTAVVNQIGDSINEAAY